MSVFLLFFLSLSSSICGDRFHQATCEYLQSSKLLVATCSMFRIVFSQLMNTFLPPYAIAGWGKNCGASQNKIMTGLGEIITGQAGRQAWMCMTGTWREAGQYIFLYFQKKFFITEVPEASCWIATHSEDFVIEDEIRWIVCHWFGKNLGVQFRFFIVFVVSVQPCSAKWKCDAYVSITCSAVTAWLILGFVPARSAMSAEMTTSGWAGGWRTSNSMSMSSSPCNREYIQLFNCRDSSLSLSLPSMRSPDVCWLLLLRRRWCGVCCPSFMLFLTTGGRCREIYKLSAAIAVCWLPPSIFTSRYSSILWDFQSSLVGPELSFPIGRVNLLSLV